MKKHLTTTRILTAAAFTLFLTACADVDDPDPRTNENLSVTPAPSDSLDRQDSIGSEPVDGYEPNTGVTEQ